MFEKLIPFIKDWSEKAIWKKNIKEDLKQIRRLRSWVIADHCYYMFKLYRKDTKYQNVIRAFTRLAATNKSDEEIKKHVNMFRKYANNNGVEIAHLYADGNANNIFFNLEEMMQDKAYDAIAKNPNMIKPIIYHTYKGKRQEIEDKNFRSEISYSDLDRIIETEKFIETIHEGRKKRQKAELINGFYAEMNRSIDQGHDYKTKIRNLREYCNDVKDQMQERAGELMVNTNES